MTRIAGVNIPDHKHTVIALTSIYGIGRQRALSICMTCNIDPNKKIKELRNEHIDSLRKTISKFTLEGDLRRKIFVGIKRLIDLGTFRGKQHRRKLSNYKKRKNIKNNHR